MARNWCPPLPSSGLCYRGAFRYGIAIHSMPSAHADLALVTKNLLFPPAFRIFTYLWARLWVYDCLFYGVCMCRLQLFQLQYLAVETSCRAAERESSTQVPSMSSCTLRSPLEARRPPRWQRKVVMLFRHDFPVGNCLAGCRQVELQSVPSAVCELCCKFRLYKRAISMDPHSDTQTGSYCAQCYKSREEAIVCCGHVQSTR